MRYLIALILTLLASVCAAEEWEDQRVFNAAADGPRLRIISSTDTALFAPLIEGFLTQNPDVSVEYLVTGTADLNARMRAAPEAFDIVISSAMDLQLKLANDGFAMPLENMPGSDWAQWHDSLFAFTQEPAAIVINRAAFAGYPVPQTRQELIEALRARPEAFRGKVGTYDIRQSGLGYLFATQDARASETFWRLMEVMGGLDLRLYCCSGDMIDDLTSGSIAVAYNVLGSYATARVEGKEALEVILPSDFQTTMMRTAMVVKNTQYPAAAEAFVRHLIVAGPELAPLPLLTSQQEQEAAVITLEPALLTYLDTLKRKKFLTAWEDAVIQK